MNGKLLSITLLSPMKSVKFLWYKKDSSFKYIHMNYKKVIYNILSIVRKIMFINLYFFLGDFCDILICINCRIALDPFFTKNEKISSYKTEDCYGIDLDTFKE